MSKTPREATRAATRQLEYLKRSAIHFTTMEEEGHPEIIMASARKQLIQAARDYTSAMRELKSFDE